jgi:predicted phage terminase large subunit-like protein
VASAPTSSSKSRWEAAAEAARREVTGSFTSWCRAVGYGPAKHHKLIIAELEAVARGEVERLALFMPPGSAKSTYASVLFVPWFLAKCPGRSIIAASHTEQLAERFGRRVRNMIDASGGLLGLAVSQDNRAAGRWALTNGAEYTAAGVGGAIAGWRAGLALIDDPVRGREDADSEIMRERAWDWYSFDLIPRLTPQSSIVLIQTRWNEDDLAGRILQHEGERWRVVTLPMECESTDDPLGRELGERLWPEWFTERMVDEAKADTRKWSALYQQRPAPETGNYFHRDWLRPVDSIPQLKELRVYGGSDYAVTSNGGDYTVHVVLGVDCENRPYLLDVWRGQTASNVWIDAWCDLVKQWRPIAWAEEQGQIISGVGPFIERRQRELKAYTAREQFVSRHDKAVRAQSIRGYMATMGLSIPRNAPWRAAFEDELLSFPAGKHDDQVDAMGLLGQLLDQVIGAPKPKGPPKPKPTDYRRIGPLSTPSMKVL